MDCLDAINSNEIGHKIIAKTIIDFIKSKDAYLLKDNSNPCFDQNWNLEA